jgi:hypothetical protein
MSVPSALQAALEDAIDAFNETGHGMPDYEPGIDTDDDWKTQLTKACRLLFALEQLDDSELYTARIELSFGTIERSLEAYALQTGEESLQDFQDHDYAYERAGELGLISRDAADDLKSLYGDNRTESYYGGRQPTDQQVEAIFKLAVEVHTHAVNMIQEGGVCQC